VDFVLLAEKGPLLEGESQGTKRVRYFKDLHLAEMVNQYAQYTREAQEAQLPCSGTFPVVFSEEALDTILIFFVSRPQDRPVFKTVPFSGWTTGNLRSERRSLKSFKQPKSSRRHQKPAF